MRLRVLSLMDVVEEDVWHSDGMPKFAQSVHDAKVVVGKKGLPVHTWRLLRDEVRLFWNFDGADWNVLERHGYKVAKP